MCLATVFTKYDLMKLLPLLFGLCLTQVNLVSAQNKDWKPVPGKISTPWVSQLNPAAPLPNYPRPQLVRQQNWQNLNGLWDYAIQPKSNARPAKYEGKILVPFAVESSLSGVGRTVGQDSLLWYKTSFTLSSKSSKTILLHFGAVDWKTEVFLNGKKVGSHTLTTRSCLPPFFKYGVMSNEKGSKPPSCTPTFLPFKKTSVFIIWRRKNCWTRQFIMV